MPSLICAARWMNVRVVNKSSIDRSIDHPFLPYTFTPSRFSHRERDAQGFHALPLLLTQVPKGDRSARPPHPPRTRRGGWRRRSGRRARGPMMRAKRCAAVRSYSGQSERASERARVPLSFFFF